MAEIVCIAPIIVAKLWDHVKPRFAMVLDEYPSDTTIEATERDVLSGLQLLWLAFDESRSIIAGATTSLYATPARKICAITLAFGVNTRLWAQFIPMVETYAKDEGCSNLRIEGREGWQRVLSNFRQPWIVLDKELR